MISKEVQLAYPDFDLPGRNGLLLGVGPDHKIMLTGSLESADRELFAHQSIFGWNVSGNCSAVNQTASTHFCFKTFTIDLDTQELFGMWKKSQRAQVTTQRRKR